MGGNEYHQRGSGGFRSEEYQCFLDDRTSFHLPYETNSRCRGWMFRLEAEAEHPDLGNEDRQG